MTPFSKNKSGLSSDASTPPPANLYADEPFAVTTKLVTGDEVVIPTKLASPLPSTVNTCPSVGVPPLSLRTTLIPGILNLVIFALPKVISFVTVLLDGFAFAPITIILFALDISTATLEPIATNPYN